MGQHLKHGAASLDDQIRRQTFPQQIVSGDGAVCQIHIGRVVHDAAVGFLWNAHVKAAVTSFHMKNWNLSTLGWNDGKAAVRIAQNQHSLGLNQGQNAIYACN